MAMVYGSSPVEHPALHMRNCRSPFFSFAALIAGSISSVNAFNWKASRKK
jgi:hypothetical protein